MAKGFTTVHLVKGKEPLLRQMVCEVRYQDGYLYLDHSGRLLKKLLQASSDWVVASVPSPAATTVFHLTAGAMLAFSHLGASLQLDKSNTDESIDASEAESFAQLAEDTLGLVFDELEVTQWLRIGCRELYYFSCDSKEDTERWLADLGVFSVSSTLADAFASRYEAAALSLVLESDDCGYRLGLAGIERSAQVPVGDNTLTIRASAVPEKQKAVLTKALKKQRQRQINSAFAAVLDIDAYRVDPVELDVAGFIRECTSANLDRFRNAIPSGNGKKGK